MTLSALRLPIPPAQRGGFRLCVTAEHIANGVPMSLDRNAIALAMVEQVPGIVPGTLQVDSLSIRYHTTDGSRYEWCPRDIEGMSEFFEAEQSESGPGPVPTTFAIGDLADYEGWGE